MTLGKNALRRYRIRQWAEIAVPAAMIAGGLAMTVAAFFSAPWWGMAVTFVSVAGVIMGLLYLSFVYTGKS